MLSHCFIDWNTLVLALFSFGILKFFELETHKEVRIEKPPELEPKKIFVWTSFEEKLNFSGLQKYINPPV